MKAAENQYYDQDTSTKRARISKITLGKLLLQHLGVGLGGVQLFLQFGNLAPQLLLLAIFRFHALCKDKNIQVNPPGVIFLG